MLSDAVFTLPVRNLQKVLEVADTLTIVSGGMSAAPGSGAPESVESLTARIAALVADRQGLRANGAQADALERNRLEIARLQWQLSQALIARYMPAA
jgi:hypothetical protein